MSFHLLGLDISFSNDIYGIWFLSLHFWDVSETPRSLIGVYWLEGVLLIDLFWIRLCGDRYL